MITKYIYKWTPNEDYSKPNNNYSEETESVTCESPYDFGDWLSDNGVAYEQDGYTYYVTEDGNRTGEAYQVFRIVLD